MLHANHWKRNIYLHECLKSHTGKIHPKIVHESHIGFEGVGSLLRQKMKIEIIYFDSCNNLWLQSLLLNWLSVAYVQTSYSASYREFVPHLLLPSHVTQSLVERDRLCNERMRIYSQWATLAPIFILRDITRFTNWHSCISDCYHHLLPSVVNKSWKRITYRFEGWINAFCSQTTQWSGFDLN